MNIVHSWEETNVAPSIIAKGDKRRERGASSKEAGNRREILTGGVDMTKKRNELRKKEGS